MLLLRIEAYLREREEEQEGDGVGDGDGVGEEEKGEGYEEEQEENRSGSSTVNDSSSHSPIRTRLSVLQTSSSASSSSRTTRRPQKNRPRPRDRHELKILDIGTGSSAIYLLLLARLSPKAILCGTELNPESLKSARENVQRNGLERRIRCYAAQEGGGILFPLAASAMALSKEGREEEEEEDQDQEEIRRAPFTFTMCNPPFYSSADEINASRAKKSYQAHAAPTASENELITRGGEVAFVSQMIDESIAFSRPCPQTHTSTRKRKRADPPSTGGQSRTATAISPPPPSTWFTSLLGKSSSIPVLVTKLQSSGIDNYFLSSIRQAHTTRWILGWSFSYRRIPDHLVRCSTRSTWKYLPKPNSFAYTPAYSTTESLSETFMEDWEQRLRMVVWESLVEAGVLEDSEIKSRGEVDGHDDGGSGFEFQKKEIKINIAPISVTWSRAARRARTRMPAGDVGVDGGEVEAESAVPMADGVVAGEGIEDSNNSRPEPIFRATIRLVNSRRKSNETTVPVQEEQGEEEGQDVGEEGEGGQDEKEDGNEEDREEKTDRLDPHSSDGKLDTIQLDWTSGKNRGNVEVFWTFLVRKIQDRLLSAPKAKTETETKTKTNMRDVAHDNTDITAC